MIQNFNHCEYLLAAKSCRNFGKGCRVENTICDDLRIRHHFDHEDVTEIMNQAFDAFICAFAFLHESIDQFQSESDILSMHRFCQLTKLIRGYISSHCDN